MTTWCVNPPWFRLRRSSSLGYAQQLVLCALQLLVGASVRASGAVPGDWATDLGAVVAAARDAADGAGRDAALALLAAIARAKPADALQHVLEVHSFIRWETVTPRRSQLTRSCCGTQPHSSSCIK